MGKIKTIYSIKGIFTKLLNDANKETFTIPTYQRGYKWTSIEANSQVRVLLNDLYSAYKTSHRYYLQFITLKNTDNTLEVIDGQQRLTTLTILFSIFHYLESMQETKNFVKGKLVYKIRNNFIDKFIYNNIDKIINSNNWEEFIIDNPNYNNQDVFYIFHATNIINKYLSEVEKNNEVSKLYDYISDRVQIITNILDDEMNSEKIFINVNKGVRLKDEDLVKGLLITRIPLDNIEEKYRLTENEINEIRSTLGRQWDEISHWATREDIKSYLRISDDNNIEWIIKLAFPNINNFYSDENPVFTFLFEKYKNGFKAQEIFKKIYETKQTLDDWFNIPEIYNLIGFLLHIKSSNNINNIWDKLSICNSKDTIVVELKKIIKEIVAYDFENNKLKELNYHDSKDDLFNIFMLLDLIKVLPLKNNKEEAKYNFKLISEEAWSIEHIFPQNTDELNKLEYFSEEDLLILKELLPDNIYDYIDIEDEDEIKKIIALYEKIKTSKNKCLIDETEKQALEYIFSKSIKDLHRLGNLTLLETGMNSSLSNNFFEKKRKKIVEKVSKGKFVPLHTYDVFSKLIIRNKTSLHVWSKKDIKSHENFIEIKINELIEYLNME